MSVLLFKWLAGLLILATSLLAGIKPLQTANKHPEHRLLEWGEALGGGIFLGIALFHMLPEAQIDLQRAYGTLHYPYANLFCALGFVVLLFLEKVILHITDQRAGARKSMIPYILPIVLSVHALTEGAALGINTTIANAMIIFIAIIVHKGSESFALATNLGRSHLSVARAMPIFLFWAMMSPLGIALGSLLTTHLQSHTGIVAAALFNAFAAGTFLYIATLHKTNHHCHNKQSDHLIEFLLLVLGLVIIAVVEIWL